MATSQSSPQPPRPQESTTAPQKPTTTQEDLTTDDGAGIRGGYGDSDQTNGLEGGANSDDAGDDAGQGQ
ncbi:hypothetical protein [Hymenobacter weizhouensis]|uniref:hypothetical protein n=1 Tax=Hymenobacter sp. YIM 151500-1 TaxID=2987689 RepID=UPI002226C116|nr:hypothetical protein [Hymenobacter sp. YIM 151500-1]UYZ63426.1 hypothetical protein OIS53_00940 [Hymenobacter sp. YIM 151500-1]